MKKNPFEFSHEIIELNQSDNNQAINLVSKLRGANENFFIEIDCSPNGQLNPFFYSNGLESVKLIKDSTGSFLGKDINWFDEKINLAQRSNFTTNFSLGEKLNLWERVTPNDYEKKLNWTQPFCLKSKNGLTKIWHPSWRQVGYKMGLSTMSSIVSFLHENQVYLQKFYAPLVPSNLSLQYRMHYRLVIFVGETQKEPELIGGLWISRIGFKIYPGKDSIVGLISPAKISN